MALVGSMKWIVLFEREAGRPPMGFGLYDTPEAAHADLARLQGLYDWMHDAPNFVIPLTHPSGEIANALLAHMA